MHLADARQIGADPATVWAAILDPEVLKACIPGCESLTGSPETGYEAIVVQKVGPVKARFTGLVQLTDLVPGRSLTLSGEGKGGPAGFAKGSAKVTMEPEGDGTRFTYAVEAAVGGKLAQLGSRIIDGFARKLADEFFNRFQQGIEGPEEAVADPVPAEAGEAPKKGWFRRILST